MLLTKSERREAMVGTISLYDSQGERLHTIQIGALPEHGKARFQERLDHELALVKNRNSHKTVHQPEYMMTISLQLHKLDSLPARGQAPEISAMRLNNAAASRRRWARTG